MPYRRWYHWLNTKFHAFLALLPFILLGVGLWFAENRGLALLSWIGGGCLILGAYRLVTHSVDYLDSWADHLYWHPRRERAQMDPVDLLDREVDAVVKDNKR